eukprot:6607665-Alexandrium_andersonii.AAC.1
MPRGPFRSRPRRPETSLRGGRSGAIARRCGRARAPAVGASAPVLRARERWASRVWQGPEASQAERL